MCELWRDSLRTPGWPSLPAGCSAGVSTTVTYTRAKRAAGGFGAAHLRRTANESTQQVRAPTGDARDEEEDN